MGVDQQITFVVFAVFVVEDVLAIYIKGEAATKSPSDDDSNSRLDSGACRFNKSQTSILLKHFSLKVHH